MATNQDFLYELRTRSQQGIARRLFAEAGESDDQLRELGGEIARTCGSKAVFGPIKGMERSAGKVAADYGGDWYDLKDVVRMTIVAPDMQTLTAVQREIRARCVPSEGLGLMKHFELKPLASPCGYSGLNFVVRLRNGRPGEIQANVTAVMYGQLQEEVFRQTMGASEYAQIKARYAIDGGLGHTFYEIYRAAVSSDSGRRAAGLSRKYFDYLRGLPNVRFAQQLQQDIASFKKGNPAFAH